MNGEFKQPPNQFEYYHVTNDNLDKLPGSQAIASLKETRVLGISRPSLYTHHWIPVSSTICNNYLVNKWKKGRINSEMLRREGGGGGGGGRYIIHICTC